VSDSAISLPIGSLEDAAKGLRFPPNLDFNAFAVVGVVSFGLCLLAFRSRIHSGS